MSRTLCQTTCSHGGLCTLDVDHKGLHSASGLCEWERSEDDQVESDVEAVLTTLQVIRDKIEKGTL